MSRSNGSAIARPLRDAPHIKERLGDGEFYLGELCNRLFGKDRMTSVLLLATCSAPSRHLPHSPLATPSGISQSRTVPSGPPIASRAPSGERPRQVIAGACCSSAVRSWRDSASQYWIMPCAWPGRVRGSIARDQCPAVRSERERGGEAVGAPQRIDARGRWRRPELHFPARGNRPRQGLAIGRERQ